MSRWTRALWCLLYLVLPSCLLDSGGPDDGDPIAVAASDLTLSGANGSIEISGMSGGALTVTYSPGHAATWCRLYLSEGNGAGLVLAAQPMSYAGGAYTYTFSHPSFTAGATIHVLVLRYEGGVETAIPHGPLGSSTSWASFSYAGSGPPGPPGPPGPGTGTFPIVFKNDTRGKWNNRDVHIQIIGMNAAGQWCTVRPNGDVVPMSPADNDAPGHLRKNGVNYASYGATLAQASTWTMPAYLVGTRIYVSVGSPVYIRPVAGGWVGPNVEDAGDANEDVYYDWLEATYAHGQIPLGINTTQVDMFGLPMTVRVQQSRSGYDSRVGITLRRAQVYQQYGDTVAAPFKALAKTHRILAPSHGEFRPGRSQANYLRGYIDDVWGHYASHPLRVTVGAVVYQGSVANGRLRFTRDGAGPFFVDKPTTHDVLAATGALARGNPIELAFEAQLDAALNRAVALDTSNWFRASAYYDRAPRNDYARFFHTVSLHGLAYGFPYDDVADQSSVRILPNAEPATRVTIAIGW